MKQVCFIVGCSQQGNAVASIQFFRIDQPTRLKIEWEEHFRSRQSISVYQSHAIRQSTAANNYMK